MYNGKYPADVAGMVLIDSAHEDEPIRAPKFFLASTAPRYVRYPLYLILNASARRGVLRLFQPTSGALDNPTRQQVTRALRQQPKSIVTDLSTGLMVPDSYKQAHELMRLGDRHLIVLTAGRPQPWSDPEMAKQAAAYQHVWIHEIEPQLTHLSSRGEQIVVENSDHGIPDEARRPSLLRSMKWCWRRGQKALPHIDHNSMPLQGHKTINQHFHSLIISSLVLILSPASFQNVPSFQSTSRRENSQQPITDTAIPRSILSSKSGVVFGRGLARANIGNDHGQ